MNPFLFALYCFIPQGPLSNAGWATYWHDKRELMSLAQVNLEVPGQVCFIIDNTTGEHTWL